MTVPRHRGGDYGDSSALEYGRQRRAEAAAGVTSTEPAARTVRYIRASKPDDVRCACRKSLTRHARTIGAALVLCKACGQWLYSVEPRTGESLAVEHALTYAVTIDEMLDIERARLNPLEALLLLGILGPEHLFASDAIRPAIAICIAAPPRRADSAVDVSAAHSVLQEAGAERS